MESHVPKVGKEFGRSRAAGECYTLGGGVSGGQILPLRREMAGSGGAEDGMGATGIRRGGGGAVGWVGARWGGGGHVTGSRLAGQSEELRAARRVWGGTGAGGPLGWGRRAGARAGVGKGRQAIEEWLGGGGRLWRGGLVHVEGAGQRGSSHPMLRI